jgi:membrane protease YdiL (CAAX protease family)
VTPAGARRARAAREAVRAAVVWTAIELAIRWVGPLLVLMASPASEGLAGRLETTDAWGLLGTATVLWMCFRRRARSVGLGWADLGYRCGRGAVLAGVAGGIVVLPVAALTAAFLDVPGFGLSWDGLFRGIREAGPCVAALMVLANGLVGPTVEEYAWRGYIQRAAIAAWGPAAGVTATSLAFVVKHVIVDLSAARVASLAAIGLGLGVIAVRWGTVASTVAHVLVNTSATLVVLALAVRGV